MKAVNKDTNIYNLCLILLERKASTDTKHHTSSSIPFAAFPYF